MRRQQPRNISISDSESPAKRMRVIKTLTDSQVGGGGGIIGGGLQRIQNFNSEGGGLDRRNFRSPRGGNFGSSSSNGGLQQRRSQPGGYGSGGGSGGRDGQRNSFESSGGFRSQRIGGVPQNNTQHLFQSNHGSAGLSTPVNTGRFGGGFQQDHGVPPPSGDQQQQHQQNSRGPSLLDFEGRFCDEARTQNGAKILIEALNEGRAEHLRHIFPEIVEGFDALAISASGNRVLQTLFDRCSVHQKDAFFTKMSGKCMSLASNQYGSFVVQKAFEAFPPRLKRSLASELRDEVVRLSCDQNGNHLVQRVVESVDPVFIEFIADELVTGGISKLALQQNPVRVIQRVLEYFEGDQLKPLVESIKDSLLELSGHQYGNYVAQAVFESKVDPDQMSELVQQVSGEILTMSKRKFANYAVEKCLKAANPEQTALLIDEMLQDDGAPFLDILQDPYGNYVAQEMLEKAGTEQRAALAALIRSRERELKLNVHARAAITKYQNLLTQVANDALMAQALGSSAMSTAVKEEPANSLDGIVKQLADPKTTEKKRLVLRIQLQADPNVSDDLMSTNGGRVTLEDTLQYLAETSVDSAGAAFLKSAFDGINDDMKDKLITAMVSVWSVLVYDVNGNYVIQKLIEISNEDQLKPLLIGMQTDFVKMSRNVCGSHVVQKMLAKISDPGLLQSLADSLKGQVVTFAMDRNANYVLQRAVETIPVDMIGFFAEEIRGRMIQMTTSSYGSKFLQTFLKNVEFNEEQRRPLIEEFCTNAYDMATDVHGNYLLQIILEYGYSEERVQLIRVLINIQGGDALVQLAQHKYACHVIEKSLEFGDADSRAKICTSFCARGAQDLGRMIVDSYANFVMLKMLEVSDSQLKMVLIGLLKPHYELAKISQNAGVRSICAKMEPFFEA